MLLRGELWKYAKNSNFGNSESTLYSTSVSMPLLMFSKLYQSSAIGEFLVWPGWWGGVGARGGTFIETLYGDVPPKWVGFWQKIPKYGSHFWPPKSLNMGPFFVKITKIFCARNASPENFPKIPKHGSIFWAKSLNMGTFFTSKHGLGFRGPGGTPPSKPKSSTPRGWGARGRDSWQS